MIEYLHISTTHNIHLRCQIKALTCEREGKEGEGCGESWQSGTCLCVGLGLGVGVSMGLVGGMGGVTVEHRRRRQRRRRAPGGSGRWWRRRGPASR